jgi:hypothetical protein
MTEGMILVEISHLLGRLFGDAPRKGSECTGVRPAHH